MPAIPRRLHRSARVATTVGWVTSRPRLHDEVGLISGEAQCERGSRARSLPYASAPPKGTAKWQSGALAAPCPSPGSED